MKQVLRTLLHLILSLALTTTSAHANWWEGGYDCACGDDPAGEYGNTDSEGNSWTDVTNGGTNPDPYGGSSTSGTSGSTGGTSGDNGMDDFTRTPSSTGGGESPEDTAYNNMPKEDPDSVTVAEELARNPQLADVMDPNETMDYMRMMNGDNFVNSGYANPTPSPDSVIGMTDTACGASCEAKEGRAAVINREYFKEVHKRQQSGQLPNLSTGPMDALRNHGLANVGYENAAKHAIEKQLDQKVRKGEWGVRMGGQAPNGFHEDPNVSARARIGQKTSITVFMPGNQLAQFVNPPDEVGAVPGGVAIAGPVSAPGGLVVINTDTPYIKTVVQLADGTFMPMADMTPGSTQSISLEHEYSHAGETAINNTVANMKARGQAVPAVLEKAQQAAIDSRRFQYTPDVPVDKAAEEKLSVKREHYYMKVTELLAFGTKAQYNRTQGKLQVEKWRQGMMKTYGVTDQQAKAIFAEVVTNNQIYDMIVKPMEDGAQYLMSEPATSPATNPHSGMSQSQIDSLYFN